MSAVSRWRQRLPLSLQFGAVALIYMAFAAALALLLSDWLANRWIAALLAVALLGTIVGHSIYLRLLRVWGAFRAGLYAFVSPVVALALGAIVLDEHIGWRELAGAAAMLGGAAVAMRRPQAQPVALAEAR